MKILFFGKVKNFFKRSKKVLILSGMALLLVITGILNYKLNATQEQAVKTTATNASFFETYKTDRTTSREKQTALLTEIINSDYATEAERATAIESKKALQEKMETEQILEGLIRSKGFEDAVVTIGSKYYNCIVKSKELTSDQANLIMSVIIDETGTKGSNIKIISLE
ncbi:MAG: SpoIIIAH-like family protein [Christensenellales bacterium]